MYARCIPILLLCLVSASAFATDPCRVTISDGYLGVDEQGVPGHLGVQARVKTFPNDGYLGAMGGKPVEDVVINFQVIFPDETAPWDLGSGKTNSKGWATFDLTDKYGKDSQGYYLIVVTGGSQYRHRLPWSQCVQVLASVSEPVSQCADEEVLPDVYGTLYFRHPDDPAPILFSDFDDTLFNSSDLPNIIRIIATGHYPLIDDEVVSATHSIRDAGAIFIGITAQFSSLRPFTRSELLRWNFDSPYASQPYYYDDEGFDGSYRSRTLTYLANNEYPSRGTGANYNPDHCEYKIEKFDQLVDGIFGGHWEDVIGMVGDSEGSDGCAARYEGIHWYALMEGDSTVEDTSDPSSYTEIHGGWAEALPLICGDAGLACY